MDMRGYTVIRRGVLLACCAVAALAGCAPDGSRSAAPPPGASAALAERLLPVPLPPLSGADAPAQQQIRQAHQSLLAMAAAGNVPPSEMGNAYGEMGRLFMAAELNGAADPSLRNAVTLLPDDPRWSYYFAHLSRRMGDLDRAAEYFERTLAASPGDVAALWWLGMTYLEQGRPAEAEPRFARALSLSPGALSAVYGLGRAALARGDFETAAKHLERVLAMNRAALAAHYPLGLAYRGLGRIEQAQAHLNQRSAVEILPIDPLMDELTGLLRSTTAYQDRGMLAARSGDWTEAVVQFRMAVESAPDDADARLNLSAALSQTGDVAGALEHARHAARLNPGDARARQLVAALTAAAGTGP
jgi:tetratricopeptide (TPR) repeat protein